MNAVTKLIVATVSTTVLSRLAGLSDAVIIYGGDTANYTSIKTITGNGGASIGVGDDYNTGAASATLTGLSFRGGVSGSVDQLFIDFYNSAGQRVSTISPSQSEIRGPSAVHTLAADDFMQNGVMGVPIPGAGYIIFSPYAYNGADNTPQFSLAAGGSNITAGSNNSTIGASTAPDPVTGLPVLSTGPTYGSPEYADFSLSGTVVPEPSILGLLVPTVLAAGRRRHLAASSNV